ncbi:MAG: hypothetical protein ABI640_20510 [Gammaproteobacteria bacterium]
MNALNGRVAEVCYWFLSAVVLGVYCGARSDGESDRRWAIEGLLAGVRGPVRVVDTLRSTRTTLVVCCSVQPRPIERNWRPAAAQVAGAAVPSSDGNVAIVGPRDASWTLREERDEHDQEPV